MTGFLERRVIELERDLAAAIERNGEANRRWAQSEKRVAELERELAEVHDLLETLGRRALELERELGEVGESADLYERLSNAETKRVGELEHAGRMACDELRRWQYADDIADVRHSIDAALRILERA